MTSAADATKNPFVKFLLIGNSGSGKTGALAPLVLAGYKLRFLDYDSGLDSLISIVKRRDPKLLSNIQFNTYRDRMQMTQQGSKVVGAPKAYVNSLKALEKWPDDESDPATWGPDTILVIDSLSSAGLAALRWAKGTNPTARDPRQWYSAAQDVIQDLIANVTDEEFRTNVIVISHIELVETPTGSYKGFVSSIGKALGPKLPRFFNTVVLSETSGSGTKVKRLLKTVPTAMIDLKTGSLDVAAEYDILQDGMAKLFEDLKTS